MFTDDMIVYVENFKINNRQKILLELISDYSKIDPSWSNIGGYSVDIQQSITFLYNQQ